MKWLNCWKSREETFFNETAFLFWCHELWKLGSSNCCILIIRNETWCGAGNLYKDLFSIYLQPSVNTKFVKPHLFDFAIWWRHCENHQYICLQESPGKNYRKTYGNSKASLWRNLSTDTPPKFFSAILCFVALVYNWYFFFQNSRFMELFDSRFSYKHCNFSHVCLLVKMASKIMTRSINVISPPKIENGPTSKTS